MQPDPVRLLGVSGHVVEKVEQHLFDQHGIHRDHEDLIEPVREHRKRAVRPAVLCHGAAHDLFEDFILFSDAAAVLQDARYRQEVFRHPDQPLGVPPDAARERFLLLGRQVLLHEDRGRAEDRRKRRAQIVRDGAQKVRLDLLPLRFEPQLLLLLDLGGQRTDQKRHPEHDSHGQRIAGVGHVQRPEGDRKDVIDAERPDQGGQDPPKIAVGEAGDQRDGQNVHGHRKGIVVVVDAGEGKADRGRQPQHRKKNAQIGEAPFRFLFRHAGEPPLRPNHST